MIGTQVRKKSTKAARSPRRVYNSVMTPESDGSRSKNSAAKGKRKASQPEPDSKNLKPVFRTEAPSSHPTSCACCIGGTGSPNSTHMPIPFLPSMELPSKARPETLFFYSHTVPEYRFFSQWYLSDFTDPTTNITFNCCEQWMMWNKATLFGDAQNAEAILKAKSPKQQKSIGRKVRNFDPAKWDAEKMSIVKRGNYLKFTEPNMESHANDLNRVPTELGRKLMSTGYVDIVEASPTDKIWGIGLRADTARYTPPSEWPGQNLLGWALMQVREILHNEDQTGYTAM